MEDALLAVIIGTVTDSLESLCVDHEVINLGQRGIRCVNEGLGGDDRELIPAHRDNALQAHGISKYPVLLGQTEEILARCGPLIFDERTVAEFGLGTGCFLDATVPIYPAGIDDVLVAAALFKGKLAA